MQKSLSSTRDQNMNLFRFLVELGRQGDRFDHMYTAIENDKKLSQMNGVDRLQAGIFRFTNRSLI
jgi:hypothetical protein